MSKISQMIGSDTDRMQCNELAYDVKSQVRAAVAAVKNRKHGEEVVEHPSHYNHGKYECIDVIEDLNLNFNLGSCLKYLWRLGRKDDEITELEKAKWYLERELQTRKAKLSAD